MLAVRWPVFFALIAVGYLLLHLRHNRPGRLRAGRLSTRSHSCWASARILHQSRRQGKVASAGSRHTNAGPPTQPEPPATDRRRCLPRSGGDRSAAQGSRSYLLQPLRGAQAGAGRVAWGTGTQPGLREWCESLEDAAARSLLSGSLAAARESRRISIASAHLAGGVWRGFSYSSPPSRLSS
jgi:hypothetical protein